MENVIIPALMETLQGKDNKAAYGALQSLLALSAKSSAVYAYLDQLFPMLDHTNSFFRSRALVLIAANAQWDEEERIDGMLPQYLSHITDPKPITARQCVQSLPILAAHKPYLRGAIVSALKAADLSQYKNSMAPLIAKDIAAALNQIQP